MWYAHFRAFTVERWREIPDRRAGAWAGPSAFCSFDLVQAIDRQPARHAPEQPINL